MSVSIYLSILELIAPIYALVCILIYDSERFGKKSTMVWICLLTLALVIAVLIPIVNPQLIGLKRD